MRGIGAQEIVACVLLLFSVFPAPMFGADTNAAMLHTSGTAWVNGTNVPRSSSAIFSGDLVQTASNAVANIISSGSSITVLSDSLVQFEGSSLTIEHGGVGVSTSKGIATTAGEVKVTPASASWTEFNVIDVDGSVRIAARKGDLTISDHTGTTTLAQGQETTRQESSDQSDKEDNRKKRSGAAAAAEGGILNSPIAVGIGAAAIAGVTAWVLIRNDVPASPSKP